MGKETFREKVKEFVGHYAYKIFLWSIGMTDEEYHIAKYDEAIQMGDPRKPPF